MSLRKTIQQVNQWRDKLQTYHAHYVQAPFNGFNSSQMAHPAIWSHSHIVSQQHHQITLSVEFNKAHTELKNAARNGTSL